MTPQTLRNLVTNGNVTCLAEALAPLTEAERRKLSTTAYQLYQDAKVGVADMIRYFSLEPSSPRTLHCVRRDTRRLPLVRVQRLPLGAT